MNHEIAPRRKVASDVANIRPSSRTFFPHRVLDSRQTLSGRFL
ncbi:MAG TPA: hypothetical protein VM821_02635 [Abditibacteriaceae bacterium]|nr:hypothetical protein [Abditibacteriaceae bacterium]